MRIGMIQIRVTNALKENVKQALDSIAKCAEQQADLCILPELWNTPFINSEIIRHDDEWEQIIPLLQEACQKHQVWLAAGTMPCRDASGRLYNRCAMISDRGEIVRTCDKLHLLEVHTSKSTYRESDVFACGQELVQIDLPWTKAGVLICFDIRFPEAARLVCRNARLLIVCAAFNEQVGKKHWKNLLCTRAMENEVFVAGVNPAEKDYQTYRSYGHSMICSPDGQTVYEMGPDEPWAVVEIDLQEADRIRKRSPFWKLRRTDLYSLKKSEEKSDEENQF
ncbi:MAG: hypothetical protein HUJ54_00620 [Erysipelotrichaceae bacterium]|nr:hypothetical protein [Erysipelotrichaceae bacterium]